MKTFVDTSVLVGAFWHGHPKHDDSLRVVSGARKKDSACALHSLAEVYATMTALPVKDVILPEQAFLFVEEVRRRFTLVSLDENEYAETIEQTAGRGFASGRIYDALILRCAAKAAAERIYTWNLKHFRSLDPEQVPRVRTP